MEQLEKRLISAGGSSSGERKNPLRLAMEEIADQLCVAVDGRFDFMVHPSSSDETVQKLGMLINFVLDAARRALSELSERNARLAELDRLKSEFLANVSHELRTPLTLILGPLETLLSGPSRDLPEHVKSLLARMQRNAGRLADLVNDLLDFAQIEAGSMEVRRQPVALAELTGELVRDAQPAAASKGLSLTFTILNDPGVVMIDQRMFEKILLNLLGNALKFTPGGGSVHVDLSAAADNLELSVRDTGIGIPAEKQHLLFTRFQQIDSALNRGYEGTGIGLALVREFAHLMGGDAEVQSTLGQGSTFTVRLPLIASNSRTSEHSAEASITASASATATRILGQVVAAATPRQRTQPGANDNADRPLILIAEDNLDMREHLEELLSDEYQVIAAVDGQQAWEIFEHQRPEMVISDIMMPRVDGLELVARIKSHPERRDTPTILLTAKAGSDAIVGGLASGADDYLSKPFGAAELRARVHAALRMRSIHRELQQAREQLRQAERLASLGTLSAGVGHDLGNLLLPVRTRLTLLEQRATGELRDDIQPIIKSVEYLGQLARGLRLLSVDAAEGSTVQVTDIHEWWSEVTFLMRMPLPRHVKLDIRIGEGPLRVAIAHTALTQAVFNLVQNAGDALRENPAGQVKIQISLSEDQKYVCVAVRDNGPGLSNDVKQRCMEPFFTTKPRARSTGLGLSLVNGLINRVGGSIQIDSAPGEGSCFTLCLPAAPQQSWSGASVAIMKINHVRLGAFLRNLLSAMNLSLKESSEIADDENAIMLIDQPELKGDIDDFLNADAARRVILFGNGETLAHDARVRHVPNLLKASTIQKTIREALAECVEHGA